MLESILTFTHLWVLIMTLSALLLEAQVESKGTSGGVCQLAGSQP